MLAKASSSPSLWQDIEDALAFAASPQCQQVLQALSNIDFASALKVIETQKITLSEELQTIDKALEIVGIFFPPVAMAASDLAMVLSVYQFFVAAGAIKTNTPHWSILPGPPLFVQN